jgi:hypothetical protein
MVRSTEGVTTLGSFTPVFACFQMRSFARVIISVCLWLATGSAFHAIAGADPAESADGKQEARTALGIVGNRFTLNGRPVFLYGISYYGGLGATEEFIRRDLDDIQRNGFNWLRVWANWRGFGIDAVALDVEGRPVGPGLEKLKWLVAECDRRGMVVDVTLSRGNGATGSPRLQTLQAHRRAVETLISALKPRRNWYLDLSNERNVRDKRFTSIDDLKALRETARRLDSSLLVAASDGGDISRDELRDYLLTANLDFVCPHRPRDAQSPARTQAATREYLAWMKEIGRVVPVHYQEPFRRGYAKWSPAVADYVTDLKGAIAGGAAGWCFHNGSERSGPDEQPRRSFDLSQKRLFEQLDAEELKAIDALAAISKAPPP